MQRFQRFKKIISEDFQIVAKVSLEGVQKILQLKSFLRVF